MPNGISNKRYIKFTEYMAVLVDRIFLFSPLDDISIEDSADLLFNTFVSANAKNDELSADFNLFGSRKIVNGESFFGVGEHEAKQIAAIRDLCDMFLSGYAKIQE